MTTARLIVIVVLGVAASIGQAQACSCIASEFSAPEAFQTYEAIFVGQVTRIDLVEHCSDLPDGRRACYHEMDATLRVWKSWKGIKNGFVTVRTGGGGGDCGVAFVLGDRYVVFASVIDDRRNVNKCSPTGHEAEQAATLAALGPPTRVFEHREGEEKW